MKSLKAFIRKLIAQTPIQYFPVTVRGGLAKGAYWTLFPNSSLWRGHTELDVEAAIRRYGSFKGATCWDLGAHFGIYMVGMAMAVGGNGHVYGFEPDPIAFKRCQRHVQMNSLSWVKLFNTAVGDFEGLIDLILENGGGTGESRIACRDEPSGNHIPVATVSMVMLDKLLETGDVRPPEFIKVDIEGYGAKALLGARQTIQEYRPTILICFHNQSELEDTRKLLQPLGYKSFTCYDEEISWEASIWRNTILRCSTKYN